MAQKIILASGSEIRRQMLENAGVSFDVRVSDVNEIEIKNRLEQKKEQVSNVVECLAIEKSLAVSRLEKEAIVIGCDQVLEFEGKIFGKPKSKEQAIRHLKMLRGEKHRLLSSVAVSQNGKTLWINTGTVTLSMWDFPDDYLVAYLNRNWDSIRHSVGSYKLEEEGVRLFSTIDGDYFTVLGMPILALLNYLTTAGILDE